MDDIDKKVVRNDIRELMRRSSEVKGWINQMIYRHQEVLLTRQWDYCEDEFPIEILEEGYKTFFKEAEELMARMGYGDMWGMTIKWTVRDLLKEMWDKETEVSIALRSDHWYRMQYEMEALFTTLEKMDKYLNDWLTIVVGLAWSIKNED